MDLLQESKARKAEKKKLVEETEDQTREVDSTWKNLWANERTSALAKLRAENDVENTEYSPYDMLGEFWWGRWY